MSKSVTHAQAVEQLQAAMEGGANLANNVVSAPSAMTSSVSELLQMNGGTGPSPPQLGDLETTEDDGYYVDDQEFLLAQSRVARQMKLKAEIQTLNTALRVRRQELKDIDQHILAFMQVNHVPHFELKAGNLEVSISKHKQPLNKAFIKQKLDDVPQLSQEEKDALIKSLFEDRQVTEKAKLRFVKKKS